MCGRYALQTPLTDLADLFDAEPVLEDPGPRFNIAPTETIPTVRATPRGREIAGLRWGLVPGWSRGPSDLPLIINARVESLTRRPAFRDLLEDRRCVVPADGFFEWRAENGLRQPYFVHRRDGRPLALAGLWDRRGELESCAIVTTDANPLLRPLHDRMPVALPDAALDAWLDGRPHDWGRLREALNPLAPELLEAFPVGRRVNRVGQDDPGILEPVGDTIGQTGEWDARPARGPSQDQLGLFGNES